MMTGPHGDTNLLEHLRDRATACHVTVYDPIPPRVLHRGVMTYRGRRCGEPVTREGLCAHHAAEKDRLS